MKARIINWGPIADCEFDLDKDLLVIYGENSVGKSYAMQVLYIVLKQILPYMRFRAYFNLKLQKYDMQGLVRQIVEWITDFSKNEELREENITGKLIQCYEEKLNEELFPPITEALFNTFGTYEQILCENPVISLFEDERFLFQIYPTEKTIKLKLPMKPVYLKKTNYKFHKSRELKSRVDVYVYGNEIQAPTQILQQQLWKMSQILVDEILSFTKDVYFLPASRSGIYTAMNSFGPVMAQLSRNRSLFEGGIQIPSIPEPITDYYMELSGIRADSEKRLGKYAQVIEEKILQGEVKFDNNKKTLTYTEYGGNQTMEMNDVSSMISEISPITAYLKYIVGNTSEYKKETTNEITTPRSILFIEEPEAHLHPKNQVELIRIFAELSKQNIKLILASHSNYIFNELNNLVLAGALDEKTYEPILMKRSEGRSITEYMTMDQFGVDDENFADVADELVEEREQLIQGIMEKLQKGTNDTENQRE